MDFFRHQARARTRTTRLVLLFGLAVVGIVAGVVLVVSLTLGPHPPLLIGAALLTVAVIGIATLVRSAQLQSGGGEVARSLGATLVPATTTDLKLRRLRNVVEEIAIASGVPVPEVYVLDNESAINAFAAGWTPADAAVAVTRGALEQLDRDELQGVIAHEFSHILNGDMRLNIRLMGVLFGITVLTIVGRSVLRGGRFRSRGKGSGGALAVALGVMVVGYIGLFFGRLIKAGVSRQREFLADAAAVQFSRQTRGLAGALKKIAAAPQGARLVEVEAEEVSHMLFGDGLGLAGWFSTHPPVESRLMALEGQVDLTPPRAGVAAAPPSPAAAAAARAPIAVAPAAIAALVGNPPPAAMDTARDLRRARPEQFRAEATDAERAPLLLCALALGREASLRALQLDLVAAQLGPDARAAVATLGAALDGLDPAQRLPLAAVAAPALHHRPRSRNEQLLRTLDAVLRADGEVDLSEWCLARLVRGQLADALEPAYARVHGKRRLVHHARELSAVLAVLARHGHADPRAAHRAWLAGLQHALPAAHETAPDTTRWSALLDHSLRVLDGLDPAGKQLVVEALVVTLQHDGHISVAEAELLRTVCAVLHCPLPLLDAA